jgi:DeoR/GlpR family transcriptional regulator of sugar metabolism
VQFAQERQAEILTRLERDGRVVSATLAEELEVSIDSIRRDLQELEADGVLKRVHGGAVRPLHGQPRFVDRLQDDDPAKLVVATLAAGLIADGDVVAMSGGTTALYLARALRPGLRATVLTSSLDVAVELRTHPGITVDVLGGRLDPASQTLTGMVAVEQLRDVRPDLCLLSPCWVDLEHGVTLRDRAEADVIRAMVERSRRVVLLTSAAKLGATGPYVVAPVERIDLLVTDGPAEDYAARGIEVLTP